MTDEELLREGRRRLPQIEQGISRRIADLADLAQQTDGRDRLASEQRRFVKLTDLLDLHLQARAVVVDDMLRELDDELDQSERASMRAEEDFRLALESLERETNPHVH